MHNSKHGEQLLIKAFTEDEGESSMLLFLVLHLLKVDQRDQNGNTILHYAARTKNITKLELAAKIVENQDKSIISYYNSQGQHCLHIAIASSTLEIVKYLMEWGKIDVNVKDLRTGNTPLHIAVMHHNDAVLEYLLDNYPTADTTIENLNKKTVYDLAIDLGHPKACMLLSNHIMNAVL